MEELIEMRKQRSQSVVIFETYFANIDTKLKSNSSSLTDKDINSLLHELR